MNNPEIRPGIRRLFRLEVPRDERENHDEADAEMRLHLKLRADQLMNEGWEPDAARIEAERLFGPLTEERERFQHSARRREGNLRLREWMDGFRQDIRYALRTHRRDPAFSLFAVLILGLGIGASATVFSLVNGVLLQPLPFHEPGRLAWISNVADDGVGEWRVQVSHFVDLAARNTTLEDLAGYNAYYGAGDAKLSIGNETRGLNLVPVTCNFIPFLGVKPLLGRSFTADECVLNAPATVMLSHNIWRQQFASRTDIVGQKLTINNAPTTVIGVLPETFDFGSVFAPGTKADLFTAFPFSEGNDRRGNTLAVIGRLKPGVPLERARSEIVTIGKQLTAEFPRRNTLRPKVLALNERINGRFRTALLVLACAVAGVMLIVSANLSSLQFARMLSRQREMGLRLALGAGRGRLIRQTLTESFVLTSCGALLGILLAVAGTRVVSRLDAFDIPLLGRVGIDGAALGFTVAVSVLTALAIGVLPALQAPADVNDSLKDGNRGATRSRRHARVRGVLVVSEIAAACVLLVGAGLLTRSFVHLLDMELGFRPAGAAAIRIDPGTRFPNQGAANAHYDESLRRVRALPGIKHAALADLLPFGGNRSWGIAAAGQAYEPGGLPETYIRVVSSSYFATMNIPILAGRDFLEGDVPGAEQVVAINETLAQNLWPNRDPIGREIIQFGRQRLRVVALVRDVRHDALEREFTNEMYFPMRQITDYRAVNLVVRTELPLNQLTSSVRSALLPLAPDLPKNEWRRLQQLVDKVASPRRFVVLLLGGFALFALVLAALGIYALVSYGVSQRTQEIGIRMALGASASELRVRIMGGTLGLACVGIVLGIAASLLLVRLVSGLLFAVTPRDPVSFAGAFLLLIVVAGAAGYFPARRASRVNPSIALREGQ